MIKKEIIRSRSLHEYFQRYPHLTESLIYTKISTPPDSNERTMNEIVRTLTSFENNEELVAPTELDDPIAATTAEYVSSDLPEFDTDINY